MAGYDFLRGIRVLELAQLGPSSLGGYLADMGAEVIKIEGQQGDPNRDSGTPAIGSPTGTSFLHLRWNRGKKSLGLDLRQPEGKAIFRRLAQSADIVIEGMKAGALERLGLGYEVLRTGNPRLVFCSLSGLGSSGPYAEFGSHGPYFDAFAGLSRLNPYALTPEQRASTDWTAIGMHAMGLYAALGVLAALSQAQRTGAGAAVEVSGAEAAAHWLPEGVNKALNPHLLHDREGFLNSRRKQACWPRLYCYATADDKQLYFQALKPKFWERFCESIGRPDLIQRYVASDDLGETDEAVHAELREIIGSRPLAEWVECCRRWEVPVGPANSPAELVEDPHFLARDNIYEVDQPGVGPMRLTGTPVKTPGQDFAPASAPDLWHNTAELLTDLLGISAEEQQALRERGVVFGE
ncbi:MAG: CaiB/BaiF CoA transferase family protein [Parahaliea sp.]